MCGTPVIVTSLKKGAMVDYHKGRISRCSRPQTLELGWHKDAKNVLHFCTIYSKSVPVLQVFQKVANNSCPYVPLMKGSLQGHTQSVCKRPVTERIACILTVTIIRVICKEYTTAYDPLQKWVSKFFKISLQTYIL